MKVLLSYGQSTSEILAKCTDTELSALHSATLLINFFRRREIYHDDNALITDLIDRGVYNCASISIISLHLLQQVGVEVFEAQFIPNHITLAQRLECGLTIYLNNGEHLLPHSVFDHPTVVTTYNQIDHETPQPAWGSLGAIYVNSGYTRTQRAVISALSYYVSALLLQPHDFLANSNIVEPAVNVWAIRSIAFLPVEYPEFST